MEGLAHNYEGEYFELKNEMQLALAKRFYEGEEGEEAAQEDVIDWIDKYGEAFHDITESQPEILDLFSEEPETALESVELKLYH